MSRTLVHLMSLMRSTEALALVGSQGPEIRDLGRIDRDLECGVGLLEYSSASLSLEEEASRTSDLVRRLQCRAYRPNLIDSAREPLRLVRNGGRVGGQRVTMCRKDTGTFPTTPLRTGRDSFDIIRLSSKPHLSRGPSYVPACIAR
jgi:hypothetical protein